MAFPSEVAERLLVACHRHCCICHKPAGSKMEIHHIVPKSEGGDDSEENGIPLCFDCHAEVEAYNPKHPKGRRFTPSELRKHKEQWFAVAAAPPWSRPSLALEITHAPPGVDLAPLLDQIEQSDLWNPDISQRLLPEILGLDDNQRVALVQALTTLLRTHRGENVRWNAALVIEFFVQWDPLRISAELLLTMANDPFFSVRSSAAVAYYHLAGTSPDAVPVDVLGRLASPDEDWYVMTPATSALLRLARTRSAAVEVLASFMTGDDDARDHAAHALERLAKADPAALREDIAGQMLQSGHPRLAKVGEAWKRIIEERQLSGQALDYYLF